MISYKEAHRRWTYDPLTGIFYWKIRAAVRTKIGARADVPTGRDGCYRCLFVKGKKLMAHKVAWLMTHGSWPDFEMDHVNVDASDNSISNLRKADRSQNACNRGLRADNQSGVKGVHWHKRTKQWVATLSKGGEIKLNKYFKDKAEAAAAYREAAEKHHGEFARHA